MNKALEPAGLMRRLAALLYDAFLLIAILLVASVPPTLINGAAIPNDGSIVHIAFILYLLSIWFGFYGWFWTHGGQTLGMSVWRIRATMVDGGGLNWRSALLRWSCGCLGLANLTLLLNRNRCGWHELLSNTRTVSLCGDTRSC